MRRLSRATSRSAAPRARLTRAPARLTSALACLCPDLLRTHPGFRRFWTGQTVSLVGDQITLIALPLVAVLSLDATPAEMGYLTAAALVPALLFSLHAGALVDRRGRRRQTMILADLGRALLLALVPAGAALGVLSMPALYVIAFLTGALGVLFMVSYNALFVALVPPDDYVGAMSLLNGSRALSSVVGPSIGGVLVQVLTAPVAIAVDAASYLVSALYLRGVVAVEPPREEDRRGLVLSGARFIASSPVVRSALLATATLNFFDYAFLALFFLYATRSLGISPGTLGLVLGAGAVGGVLGSLVTGRVVRRIGVGPAFVVGCVVFPLPLLLVPLAGGPQWAVLLALLAAEFGAGLGVMMLDISIGAIFAAVIPDRLRSRVAGAYMVVNYGVRPLGSLLAGVLATAIGTRETLWVAAAGGCLAVLWLVRSPLIRLRALPGSGEEISVAGPVAPNDLLADGPVA
jgi:MFS family permease